MVTCCLQLINGNLLSIAGIITNHEKSHRKAMEDASESGLTKYHPDHPLFWFTNETQTQKAP